MLYQMRNYFGSRVLVHFFQYLENSIIILVLKCSWYKIYTNHKDIYITVIIQTTRETWRDAHHTLGVHYPKCYFLSLPHIFNIFFLMRKKKFSFFCLISASGVLLFKHFYFSTHFDPPAKFCIFFQSSISPWNK